MLEWCTFLLAGGKLFLLNVVPSAKGKVFQSHCSSPRPHFAVCGCDGQPGGKDVLSFSPPWTLMPGAVEYAVTSEVMAAISLAVASLQQAAEGT